MKKIFLILVILVSFGLNAQTNPHQVINSAGSDRQLGTSNVYITDNVGEPFTQTHTNSIWMLTQGFLQPFTTSSKIVAAVSGVTCADKDDGLISIAFSTPNKMHSETYYWYPATACPKNDCGNTVKDLKAGTYSVMIVSTYTNAAGVVKNDTVRQTNIIINDSKEICKVKLFTAFTPNGDGTNDKWDIGNIEEFPKNKVTIFNRWGIKIFEVNGYVNNSNDKSWPSAAQLDSIVASTYFYIIDLGDGSKPYKGWVEVIKN